MADRSVVYRLRAEIGQFQSQMAQASGSVKKLADDATKADKAGRNFRQGLETTGNAAGKVGLVAAAGLGAVVKASMDWESAWTGVTKTVDGSATQMATLEGQLRNLAKTMPATHTEIAAVAEAAGQLGVAREDITSFTKVMLELGETTNLTSDEAATSIAQMANVMRTAPEDIDNLGAALVALGNDGASTERDIIMMSQRISAAGAQIGLAESDILAISNAAASMGIEVEAGGTAISRVFTELAKATATGGPKLEAFAATAGVSADEFKRLFTETPADAFAAFTTGLDRINKSGGNVFGVLKSLGMSDVRVSQALLSMAASGDLLTNSLDLGRKAWQENTALSDEFAKRLGTTSSQVQISWNNIKDSAIDAGAAMLPVVEGVAKTVSTMADTFQSLPGPIKNATGPVLGLTAAVGGGVWAFSRIIQSVANTREAMAQMGTTSGAAATKLGKIGGKATGIFIAAQAVGALVNATLDLGNAVNASDVARDLERMAAGGTTKSLDELASALEGVNEAGGGTVNALFAIPSAVTGIQTSFATSKETVEQFDQALASMVESGNADQAAAAFKAIREAAKGHGGVSDNDVVKSFDAYKTALANAKAEGDGAAKSSKDVASATGQAGDAAAAATADFAAMAKAQQQAREAANKTATSFFNLGDSLNDSKVSLRDWIKDMADQADALRNFRINAQTAANKGLRQGLIKALQEAGPEGAMRMKQLANATDDEIRKANRAWVAGQREVRKYTDTVAGVPANKSTTVTVNTRKALGDIGHLQRALNALHGRTINVTTIYRETKASRVDALDRQGSADGSFVPKTGLPYADRHPYLLADGEGITTNRHGETDRFRDVITGINAGLSRTQIKGMLADGGFVGMAGGGFTSSEFRSASRNFDLNAGQSVAETIRELRAFSREVRRAGGSLGRNFGALSKRAEATSRSLNRAKDTLEVLRGKRDEARSNAAGSFNNNAFGGTFAESMLQLRADRNDSRAQASNIAALRKRGISSDLAAALAGSGNLGLTNELRNATPAQLQQYQAMFASRAIAQKDLGNQAAAAYAGQINAQNELIKRQTAVLNRLEARVERGASRGVSKDRKKSKAKGRSK